MKYIGKYTILYDLLYDKSYGVKWKICHTTDFIRRVVCLVGIRYDTKRLYTNVVLQVITFYVIPFFFTFSALLSTFSITFNLSYSFRKGFFWRRKQIWANFQFLACVVKKVWIVLAQMRLIAMLYWLNLFPFKLSHCMHWNIGQKIRWPMARKTKLWIFMT